MTELQLSEYAKEGIMNLASSQIAEMFGKMTGALLQLKNESYSQEKLPLTQFSPHFYIQIISSEFLLQLDNQYLLTSKISVMNGAVFEFPIYRGQLIEFRKLSQFWQVICYNQVIAQVPNLQRIQFNGFGLLIENNKLLSPAIGIFQRVKGDAFEKYIQKANTVQIVLALLVIGPLHLATSEAEFEMIFSTNNHTQLCAHFRQLIDDILFIIDLCDEKQLSDVLNYLLKTDQLKQLRGCMHFIFYAILVLKSESMQLQQLLLQFFLSLVYQDAATRTIKYPQTRFHKLLIHYQACFQAALKTKVYFTRLQKFIQTNSTQVPQFFEYLIAYNLFNPVLFDQFMKQLQAGARFALELKPNLQLALFVAIQQNSGSSELQKIISKPVQQFAQIQPLIQVYYLIASKAEKQPSVIVQLLKQLYNSKQTSLEIALAISYFEQLDAKLKQSYVYDLFKNPVCVADIEHLNPSFFKKFKLLFSEYPTLDSFSPILFDSETIMKNETKNLKLKFSIPAKAQEVYNNYVSQFVCPIQRHLQISQVLTYIPEAAIQFELSDSQSDENDQEICSICSGIIHPVKADTIQLMCEHQLHYACYRQYIQKFDTCPLCRKPIKGIQIQGLEVVKVDRFK